LPAAKLEPQGKLYIRDGHEKKSQDVPQEVAGEQIAAVYNLFK
jgi:hypothetical protein